MPVVDQQTDAPELSPTELAGGLVSNLRDPLKGSTLVRDLNKILEPLGYFVGHRLLTPEDVAARLGVPFSVAKKIVNVHADIQCGRYWRMSEQRFSECISKGRFKTQT